MWHKLLGSCAFLLFVVLCQTFEPETQPKGALVVDAHNLKSIVDSNELILLLFYSNRCKFSTQLVPIFERAADQVRSIVTETGKVLLGKVDSPNQLEMESHFDIGKYPTIKLIRYGILVRDEYRGQRSEDAIVQFTLNELKDPTQEIYGTHELQQLANQRYIIAGYFESKDQFEYHIYRKASISHKNNCQFFVHIGGRNKITFNRDLTVDREDYKSEFSGNMTDLIEVLSWMEEKCEPMVRELTFENAEQITEEARPFIILFHRKDDTKSVKEFEHVIETQLQEEMQHVSFLTADGDSFSHPLYHMDKKKEDLPLIVADSFVHMYTLPKFEDIHKPGKLKSFIRRLLSGELHEKFHYDPELKGLLIEDSEESQETTTPKKLHQSKFKELLPSKNRYTFVRDEL